MKTDIETLARADWDGLEAEVVTKLRLIKTAVRTMDRGPLNDQIANDLFRPCLELLAHFCAAVTLAEEKIDGVESES